MSGVFRMSIVDAMFDDITEGEGHSRSPYIRDESSIKFECDGKEGTIYFNGYFYVENHAPPYPEDDLLKPWERDRHSAWLPRKYSLTLTFGNKIPCNDKCSENKYCSHSEFTSDNYETYEIEIYKKETHDSTDEFSKVEDGDEDIDVCFFPTNYLTLHFRLLRSSVDYKK